MMRDEYEGRGGRGGSGAGAYGYLGATSRAPNTEWGGGYVGRARRGEDSG